MIQVPKKNRLRSDKSFNLFQFVAFLLAHAGLALAMNASPFVANAHAYGVCIVGICIAAFSRHREKAGYVGAYIVGSQVLWAMVDANVYFEYGKYAAVLVLGVSLLRNLKNVKPAPMLYFACMLPSLWVLFRSGMEVGEMRDQISFNLSGHLVLLIAVLYFQSITINKENLQKLLLLMLGPIVAMSILILKGIAVSSNEIEFGLHSMFETSGGVGPNRVSSILGLGSLAALFYVLFSKQKNTLSTLLIGLGIGLGAQSALTFSRGGLYCAGLAVIAASFALIRNKKKLIRYIVILSIFVLAAEYYVLPKLTEMTDGKIISRFENTHASGRRVIAETDYKLWLERPIFGWGPGGAAHEKMRRFQLDHIVAAHTEYTRLLAEHGIFGLIAIAILLSMGFKAYLKAKNAEQKSVVLTFMTWGLAFMMVNATRLAAPSFIIGLTFVNLQAPLLAQESKKKSLPRPRL